MSLRSRRRARSVIPRFVAARCVLPLAAGGAIYLLRPARDLLAFRSLDLLGLGGVMQGFSPQGQLPTALAAVLMSGPSLLWMYATVSWVVWVWREHVAWETVFWISLTAALGPMAELSQRWGWMSGTFDPLDVTLGMVGALVAVAQGRERRAACGGVEA